MEQTKRLSRERKALRIRTTPRHTVFQELRGRAGMPRRNRDGWSLCCECARADDGAREYGAEGEEWQRGKVREEGKKSRSSAEL
eukprot:5127074-Pleurochrysis_carterae.AAC.1